MKNGSLLIRIFLAPGKGIKEVPQLIEVSGL